MIKIKTIKKENGEVSISLTLQTLKIKQRFSGMVFTIVSAFRAIRNNLRFKLKLCCIIFKVLGANPQKISLKEEGGETLLFLSREEKAKKKTVNSPWENLIKSVTKIFKKPEKKIVKGTAILSIIALILQISIFVIPSTKATENGLCPFAVDVVQAVDTTGSMDDGYVPSQCQWENLEWVENEYGGTFMCVYHQQSGLPESECQKKDDGRPQCPYGPVYTPPVPKKIDATKEAAESFIDNLGPNDQSALVSFNNTAILEKNLSNDHLLTKTAIDGLTPQSGTGTNIGDAILGASNELTANGNLQALKVIILLTDGKANKPNGPGSGEYQADVDYAILKAQEADNLGYKIFTIGLGSGVNQTMLQNIADSTGGQYHYAVSQNDLAGIFDQISQEICQFSSSCQLTETSGECVGNGQREHNFTYNYPYCGEDYIETQEDLSCSSEYQCSEWENTECVGNGIMLQNRTCIDQYENETEETQEIEDLACYTPVCGNSILDEGEECDDGNTSNDDGCSSTCQIESPLSFCGDGTINGQEQCDDGNTNNGDGCSAICENESAPPGCGDGVKNGTEECDGTDGVGAHQSCSDQCILSNVPYCGDQTCNGQETCDICSQDCGSCPCNLDEELVVNGGFETPEVTNPAGWDVFNSSNGLTGWSVEWLSLQELFQGVVRPIAAVLELQKDAVVGDPHSGNQLAELDSDWFGPDNPLSGEPAPAKIYQDLQTVPGRDYTISFWFSPRPSTQAENNALGFDWNNGAYTTTVTNGAGENNTNWTQHTYIVTATSSTTRIQFSDLGQPSDDLGTYLDDVSVRCKLAVCGDEVKEGDERCDDGNNIDGDGCSAICTIEPLIISEETSSDVKEASITITWTTNHSATSRVIYDTVSHATLGDAPNYGYANSTTEDTNLVTDHSVVVSGLTAGTTYYFRSVSHGSPESVSSETFATTTSTVLPVSSSGGGGGGSLTVYSVACGDNIVDLTYEQCDDGNTIDGDGCSSICKIEMVAGASTEQQGGEGQGGEEGSSGGEVLGEATEQLPNTGVNPFSMVALALFIGFGAILGIKKLLVNPAPILK